MLSLYERIELLCSRAGITVTDLSRNTKISRASFSDLKMGRKNSFSSKTLQTIADYFNVSVDYLLTGEEQIEKAPAKAEAEDDVGILLDNIQDKLKSGEDIMFNGYKLSPESAAALAASIEAVDAMTAKLAEQAKDKRQNRR